MDRAPFCYSFSWHLCVLSVPEIRIYPNRPLPHQHIKMERLVGDITDKELVEKVGTTLLVLFSSHSWPEGK
jgi:hypothetical protein